MRKKKYLPLYYKWVKDGEMPGAGLCSSFDYSGLGFDHLTDEFCADQLDAYSLSWTFFQQSNNYEFNATRQNIVLLLACLNNEL